MNKPAPVMFVGTGSDVGKSIINAAFCRILKQDGYQPAPFKAQNMSLNSYPTSAGGEIGRAQAVQAEACGVDCSTDMNPVLLKPTGDCMSQVILNGKPIGNQSASEYFDVTDRDRLFQEAMKGYYNLAKHYNPIVIEGAGSISEMNLWEKDITNMRVAREVGAPAFLIADIDRGGVFGSIYGTIQLLPEEERNLVKGIIINKFRGDISLFEKGKDMLEKITGKPVLSIIPYFKDIYIEQEDSVVMEHRKGSAQTGHVNVAVVLLRHMSNFTDFNHLERIPGVHLYYTHIPEEVEKADIILIPGSKNTISDMQHLRNTGLASAIMRMHDAGRQIYGICGGYQIMGKEIRDPDHIEGNVDMIPGLGILPVVTTIQREKTTEQCSFLFLDNKDDCKGYEIHMGHTVPVNGVDASLCTINPDKQDGYYKNKRTWGTYIHGIFDNQVVIDDILNETQKLKDPAVAVDYTAFKEEHYDKLAAFVRKHTNMELFYKILHQS
jgi:adenosylcobyric acid synthase